MEAKRKEAKEMEQNRVPSRSTDNCKNLVLFVIHLKTTLTKNFSYRSKFN